MRSIFLGSKTSGIFFFIYHTYFQTSQPLIVCIISYLRICDRFNFLTNRVFQSFSYIVGTQIEFRLSSSSLKSPDNQHFRQSPRQWLSNLSVLQNHLQVSFQNRWLRQNTRISDSIGLGWNQTTHISNKFQCDNKAVNWGTTLRATSLKQCYSDCGPLEVQTFRVSIWKVLKQCDRVISCLLKLVTKNCGLVVPTSFFNFLVTHFYYT